MSRNALSIIIPSRHDEAALQTLLSDIARQQGLEIEVLIADASDSPPSLDLPDNLAARLISCEPGRGRQMNQAWPKAQFAYLLFLHADSGFSRPDQLARALDLLRQEDDNPCAGHFPLRFARQKDGHDRFFHHLEAKSHLNRPETINGDQGLLIRRDFLQSLGGFDDSLPFLEDQAISDGIFRHGRWVLLPDPLITSARRFEDAGHLPTYLLMMLIMCARRAGARDFLERAPRLYPEALNTQTLALSPFLEHLLRDANEIPDFWLKMADYSLDNSWQLGFLLEQHLHLDGAQQRLQELAAGRSRRWLRPLLSRLLQSIFKGPALALCRRLETQAAKSKPPDISKTGR